MGISFSSPIAHDPGLGYVGVSLTRPNIVRLIHAPHEVVNATLQIIEQVNEASGHTSVFIKSEYGITQIKLKADCFATGRGKLDATYGKLLCLRLLSEMHKMGYDLVASCDLAQTRDHSTLFFVKTSSERLASKIICLAPGQTDTLILLPAQDQLVTTVRAAVEQIGIQKEEDIVSCGQSLHEFKLRGQPWKDYAGAQNVQCRQMVADVIGKLGAVHYKLIGGINLKGETDSLFFMYDQNYTVAPSHFSIISLNKSDRLRLINCVDMSGPVREALNSNSSNIQREEDKYGSWEFKLKGYPWNCSGEEAIKSRRLICRISEAMLEQGKALTNALDISRTVRDKSVLLYTASAPLRSSYACIALLDRREICLIDFPADETAAIKGVIESKYLPGINMWRERDENCWQIKLKDSPWSNRGSQSSSSGVHARSMLMYVIKMASSLGWTLISSADVSAKYVRQDDGPDYPLDVHSLYFVHLPWTKVEQNTVGGGFSSGEDPGKLASGGGIQPSFAPPSYNDAIQNYSN